MTSDTDTPPTHRDHRTYGRVGGRPLSRRQAELVETLLPRLAIPETPAGAFDPATLFANPPREIWLEIGFGGGEHVAGQALRNGDVGILAAEPFLEGVAKLLGLIVDSGVQSVRIRRGDARSVIEQLSSGSIARVFILFPDPWPKTRHHKRRLIQPGFLDQLARVLAPGGRVRFATDWADYAGHALRVFLADGRFDWQAQRADDWRRPPPDHVVTRYQEKRLGDCAPIFLDFVYRPRART